MIVYPNAKINIGLNITSKRPDGFHNIESIFYPIPWHDILEINKSDSFEFSCSGLLIDGESENNLVIKAYNLIKNKYNITPCKIHLHKQIPMGAGLGGGSADASFTLTTLNKLFDLNISNAELEKLADSLGSDCPFFIDNTVKYVSGKGEVMQNHNLNLKGFFIKLVNPNIHISTKKAFSGIKPNESSFNLNKISLSSINQKDSVTKNDFEKSVFPQYPLLQEIKTKLNTEDAFYTSMTGTGSTLYGLYKTKPDFSFTNYTEEIFEL